MEIGSVVSLVPSSQGSGQSNKRMSALHEQQQEAIALKKALEWELSLDSRDIRSHAWYHGSLPRQRAEEIVQKDGDFLIRDCASQPDNYVLTCFSRGNVLHFVINKILLQPETVYERVQYQFEEDAFDAVPDLITYYVGSGKPISAASGARIQYPCNRYYPLSFYGHKIVGNQLHTQLLAGLRGANTLKSPLSHNSDDFHESLEQQNDMCSPPTSIKRDIPPKLPIKKPNGQTVATKLSQNADTVHPKNKADHASRLLTMEKCHSMNENTNGIAKGLPYKLLHSNGFQTIARCNNATEPVDQFKFTTHSLPRTTANILRNGISNIRRNGLLQHEWSLDHNNCSFDEEQILELAECGPSPPPKPARMSNMLSQHQVQGHQQKHQGTQYRGSGSDSGNGSGDSLQSSLPNDINNGDQTLHRGVIIKNPRFMSNSVSSSTLKSLNEFDAASVEDQLFTLELPEYKPESCFDIENYTTLLLPVTDNKPLDGDALNTFKVMLLESSPKIIAEHLTRIDIGLLIGEVKPNIDGNETEESAELPSAQQVIDCCGLEKLTLPHGKLFREDLIERTQCLKLMVAVTILTCHTDLDRAELLSRWIQIAVETKTALGNLFGFCAIMLGLCMQQIQKLDQAWHILRQKFTESAFTFEAKLRPTLVSMNECSNPQAPNTTVPHVLPYILLRDRPIIDLLSSSVSETSSTLYNVCIASWESRADDFGMGIHFLHLDSVRNFLQNLSQFRKNSKLLLEESSSRLDELLSDALRTEFHVKFLWGSIGATSIPQDRHSKLEKVLSIMADKFSSADQKLIH